MLRPRTKVRVVCFIKRGDRCVSGLRLIVLRFVVQKSNLKMILVRGLLQERKIVIRKRAARAVPIHDERGDPHVLRLLNLVS